MKKKKINRNEIDRLNAQVSTENRALHKWITTNYGSRCPKFYPGCLVCKAWIYYDDLAMVPINSKNIQRLIDESPKKRERFVQKIQREQINDFISRVKKFPEMYEYLKDKVGTKNAR